MNLCRKGFIRWSSLLEPCGSHQDDASALKCDTSVSLTELCAEVLSCVKRRAVLDICVLEGAVRV